jgi:site-specific recombinase XerC
MSSPSTLPLPAYTRTPRRTRAEAHVLHDAAERGVALEVIRELIAHADVNTTQIYVDGL